MDRKRSLEERIERGLTIALLLIFVAAVAFGVVPAIINIIAARMK